MRIASVGRAAVVRVWCWLVLVATVASSGATVDGPDAALETMALSLRLPITGTRDELVRGAILRQLDRLERRLPERGLLVLRFDVE